MPDRAKALIVISPFLDVTALARLPRTDGRRVLLSRADSLDRVGAVACEGLETLVLEPMADVSQVDELLDGPDDAASAVLGPPHAGCTRRSSVGKTRSRGTC